MYQFLVPGRGIGIFEFVDDSGVRGAGVDFDTFRRFRGIAVGVAEEDGVGETQHEAVGTGATHDWLVVVIAHGISVGQILQVRRIAFLDVVEGHRGGTFTGGQIGEIEAVRAFRGCPRRR